MILNMPMTDYRRKRQDTALLTTRADIKMRIRKSDSLGSTIDGIRMSCLFCTSCLLKAPLFKGFEFGISVASIFNRMGRA